MQMYVFSSSLDLWSGRGCKVAPSSNDSYTECHCYHLTNFAILTDIFDVMVSDINQIYTVSCIFTGIARPPSCTIQNQYFLFSCQYIANSFPVDKYHFFPCRVTCRLATRLLYQYCHTLVEFWPWLGAQQLSSSFNSSSINLITKEIIIKVMKFIFYYTVNF